ncbi:glycosyltransferase [bacterium]|nr:glycosyltransferase [bacterium]RIK72120.1 MAG: hypothetical protein DCC62_20545 [candidate division KSB1 bacterium]
MRAPVTVVYLTDKLAYGGTPLQIVELALHLDRARFRPYLIALSQIEAAIRERLEQSNIQMECLEQANWVRVNALPAAWKLYRSLRRLAPEIVHAFLTTGNVLGAVLGTLARVPVIVSSHRDLGGFDGKWITRMNFWTDRHLATSVTANSLAVREALAQRSNAPAETIRLLYNGIDLKKIETANRGLAKRQELGLPPNALAIGVIANIRVAKGHQYLLEAFNRIAPHVPQACLLICGFAGDHDLMKTLQRLAAAGGAAGRVRFMNSRNDIPEMLHALDVVVSPSLSEGFSNAILEAMAAGKPVIATRVGGSPEQIIDGVTGLLVPPQDAGAIAQALLTLLRSPGLRREMGTAAQRHVQENFSVAIMTRNHTRLYDDLLRART